MTYSRAFFAALLDELEDLGFEKTAMNRVTRELLKRSPGAAQKLLKGMSRGGAQRAGAKAIQEQAAYKVLGNKAYGRMAATMEGAGAGHDAGHVRAVTKNTQGLLGGRDMRTGRALQQSASGINPREYRRATLGSLLHDTGRHAEIAQAAKGITQSHGELGNRSVKDFMRKNKGVARFLPETRGVAGDVRVHDTDNWKNLESMRTSKTSPRSLKAKGMAKGRVYGNPSAGAVYLGDKMEGFGRTGYNRTLAFGRANGRPFDSGYEYAVKKNLPKYKETIEGLARGQQTRQHLFGRLEDYYQHFEHGARLRGVPLRPRPSFTAQAGESYKGPVTRAMEAGKARRAAAAAARPVAPQTPGHPTMGTPHPVQPPPPPVPAHAQPAPAPGPTAAPAPTAPAARPAPASTPAPAPKPAPAAPAQQPRPAPAAAPVRPQAPAVAAPVRPLTRPAMTSTPQLRKMAMAMKDYVNLYTKAVQRNVKPKVLKRAIRMLGKKNRPFDGAYEFRAMYSLPTKHREKLMKMLFDV